MFVDASALTAILVREEDADDIEARLLASKTPLITSALALFETALAVSARLQIDLELAAEETAAYASPKVRTVPITTEIGRLAISARARYGKGTGHPAKLNLGDCFAYACAKAHAVPLLYKGDDFVHTDLA